MRRYVLAEPCTFHGGRKGILHVMDARAAPLDDVVVDFH
jgi:hypothetical protein